MSYFPENYFSPSEYSEYCRRIKEGYKIACSSKAAILTLVRNSGKYIDHTFLIGKEMGSLFADYKFFIYENDSRDNTKLKLKVWQKSDSRNVFKSEQIGWRKWPQVKSGLRGEQMAYYRNQNREMAKEFNPDYYIVFDSDIFGISSDGILHSLSFLFDAMLSNGLFYSPHYKSVCQYDTWALRINEWPAKEDRELHGIIPPRGDKVIPVLSAFGGMGLYTKAAYENCSYSGTDCEHVLFHKDMRNKGYKNIFVNPSQLVLYNDVTRLRH